MNQGVASKYRCLGTFCLSVALALSALGQTRTSPVDLGVAGPDYWSVLSLGGPTSVRVGLSDVTTVGSGGIAGSITEQGIAGTWLLSSGTMFQQRPTGTVQQNVSLSGGVQVSISQSAETDSFLAHARAAALNASATARTLATTPGFDFPSTINMNQTQTIYGRAGVNVLNLTDLVLTGGSVIFNAPKSASFVVNVADHFKLSGGADLLVAGGLSSADLLFNIVGAGSGTLADRRVDLGEGGGEIHGIILAPERSITLRDGVLYGQIIGGFGRRDEIQILSRSRIFTPVPEPATIIGGLALVILIALSRVHARLRHV